MSETPLWFPSAERIEASNMMRFIEHLNGREKMSLDYPALHRYSLARDGGFWRNILEFLEVEYTGESDPINLDWSFDTYAWFPNLQLNFAKNLLAKGHEDDIAIVSIDESGRRGNLSYGSLRRRVAALQKTIQPHIQKGEVLACYLPNLEETVVAMLATSALGGVFTSTSSDFGVGGVVDRFSQAKPKVLITCEEYKYNGKTFAQGAKNKEIIASLPSLKLVITCSCNEIKLSNTDTLSSHDEFPHDASAYNDALECLQWHRVEEGKFYGTPRQISFVDCQFSDPLYIMYSSGTTGKPKCIMHSVGGTLLQHLKELGLHCDHKANKNLFFFTTCGWMMWNWLISGLYFGGKITLYDGSPAYPSISNFLDKLSRAQVNILGTSPKFISAMQASKEDFSTVDFECVETILSTGSPLLPEQFDYVYQNLKRDVLLGSIAGGTDILGCFFLANPVLPVYRGELQCAGLGMDVVCYDSRGRELPMGEEGELVCKTSFPSRPLQFLGDTDGSKIKSAYFSKFPDVWYHGDYLKITESGGAIFLGRSDATLNPGGIRIGTAEIYRHVETLPEISDSLCVGLQKDGDVQVVLFVKLESGLTLNQDLIAKIKDEIRQKTTARHVPKYVLQVGNIPYTRSGKKVELAVTHLINGRKVENKDALVNAECLQEYEALRTSLV